MENRKHYFSCRKTYTFHTQTQTSIFTKMRLFFFVTFCYCYSVVGVDVVAILLTAFFSLLASYFSFTLSEAALISCFFLCHYSVFVRRFSLSLPRSLSNTHTHTHTCRLDCYFLVHASFTCVHAFISWLLFCYIGFLRCGCPRISYNCILRLNIFDVTKS